MMPLGDWATGTMLRPLRAITEFDPATGVPTASVFECEVYAPSRTLIVSRRFTWVPSSLADAQTVAQLAASGLADIMTAEGLIPFVPST
jgi:hypothetical protein